MKRANGECLSMFAFGRVCAVHSLGGVRCGAGLLAACSATVPSRVGVAAALLQCLPLTWLQRMTGIGDIRGQHA